MSKETKDQYNKIATIIISLIVGFIFGSGLFSIIFKSRYPDYEEQTYHYILVQKGYNYCPYCGEEIKEDSK